jgi:hypothetical protein
MDRSITKAYLPPSAEATVFARATSLGRSTMSHLALRRSIEELWRKFTANWSAITISLGIHAAALNRSSLMTPAFYGVSKWLTLVNAGLFVVSAALHAKRVATSAKGKPLSAPKQTFAALVSALVGGVQATAMAVVCEDTWLDQLYVLCGLIEIVRRRLTASANAPERVKAG